MFFSCIFAVMNEIKSLTGIRGIAALWVVIFHYFFTHFLNLSTSHGGVFNYAYNIVSNGYLAVDLFFMLSAIVLSLSYQKKFSNYVDFEEFKTYLYKRIARIYPLYFFTIVLTFFFQKKLSISHVITHLTFTEVFFNTYFETLNFPIWSLATEMFVYLIFPFVFYLIFNFKRNFNIVLALVSVIALYFIQYRESFYVDLNLMQYESVAPKNNLDINWGNLAYIRTILVYVIGLIAFKYSFALSRIVLFAFISLFILSLVLDLNDVMIVIGMICIPAAIVKINFLKSFLSWKPIHYLGEISYSIYLNHIIIIYLLKYYFPNLPMLNFLAFPLLIAVSVVTYHYIEKPGKKYLLSKLISSNR